MVEQVDFNFDGELQYEVTEGHFLCIATINRLQWYSYYARFRFVLILPLFLCGILGGLQEFLGICYLLKGDEENFEKQKHKLRIEFMAAQLGQHTESICHSTEDFHAELIGSSTKSEYLYSDDDDSPLGGDSEVGGGRNYMDTQVSTTQKKILIVAAASEFRQQLKSILRELGHIAFETLDFLMAMEFLTTARSSDARFHFDAIVLDMTMLKVN